MPVLIYQGGLFLFISQVVVFILVYLIFISSVTVFNVPIVCPPQVPGWQLGSVHAVSGRCVPAEPAERRRRRLERWTATAGLNNS